MGFKTLKEEYNIGHIVQVVNSKIFVGSGYVPDLIIVSLDGEVEWGKLGSSKNDDLTRYYKEMTSDKERLLKAINAQDEFEASLPVYSCNTDNEIELVIDSCDEYGWPNCTHSGKVMYDNMFFKTAKEAVDNARGGLECSIRFYKDQIERTQKKLEEEKEQLNKDKNNLEILNNFYVEE